MNFDKKNGYQFCSYLDSLIYFKILCKNRLHKIKNISSNLNEFELDDKLNDIEGKYNKIYIEIISKINIHKKNNCIDLDFLNHMNHKINMLEIINENITQDIFNEIIQNG